AFGVYIVITRSTEPASHVGAAPARAGALFSRGQLLPTDGVDSRVRRDGIHVHGWWTINVMNADGTVAVHREFENHLDGGGQQLVNVLARKESVGSWFVFLVGTPEPCTSTAAGGPQLCVIS